MAFEPWELPPLPESPVVPLRRVNDGAAEGRAYASTSPSKSLPRSTYEMDMNAVDTMARSPNKQSPFKHERLAQSRSPSSPRKPKSPVKIPLPPSPTRTYLSPPKPTAQAESSFMMPANLSESLIGDTSIPTMLMDESLDFGMNSVCGNRGLPRKEDLGYRQKLDKVVEGSTTPTKVIDKTSATLARTVRKASSTTEAVLKATKAPLTAQRAARERVSPTKTPSTNRGTRPFPTSSSHPAVHRLIDAGDVSTLLPASPARTAHLTRDEHQLLRESLPSSEGPSFFLPPPPSSTRKSPRKPNKADMTLDINDLMAKTAKPKRPSGTEESFEDLLNGPDLEFDQTMIGNESFLPADLRPCSRHMVSPVKHTPAKIRNAAQVETARRSPAKIDLPAPKSTSRPQAGSSPRRPVDSPIRPGIRSTPAAKRSAPAVRLTPAAAASTRRVVPASTGRRVSLSTGALPLPTSASQPKLSTPSVARSGHSRSGSTVTTGTSGVSGVAALSQSGSARSVAGTSASTGATGLTRTGSSRAVAEVGARSNASPARPSATAPRTSIAVPRPGHARTGSTTSLTAPSSRTAPSTSRPAGLPTTSSSRPASFRPTSQMPAATKSSLPPSTTRTTKSTLPLPGTGPSARSALTRPTGSTTTTSRVFGTDGAGTTNRLSARPGGSTLPSGRSATTVPGKLSMAPPASPAKRETTASLKSRAASTPAEHLTRGLARPDTKSSIPPAGTARSAQASSTIPRPPTSRLPAATSSSSKLPSASSRNSASIQALRARIDALSARQGDSRR